MIHFKHIQSILVTFVIFSFVLFFGGDCVLAVSNPQTVPNNKFGISVATADDREFIDAARLVNSSGGEWGYVTVVIQENDRDAGKWQNAFNKMRHLKLIPIVRLATEPDGSNWKRPTSEQAGKWVEFLNSLNWVVKNRYVVLFNEPNHATEWGGEANPEDYGTVAYSFARAFKKSNPDYFIMLAGLDQAAPLQPPRYIEEGNFLSRMYGKLSEEKKNIFDYVDGLASHSYPNPGFIGSPTGSGRGSVRGYEWELSYLQNFDIKKELPVFITETGWQAGRYLTEDNVAENYRIAYESVWLPDERVVAVTPFLLNYQMEPFLGFSFRKQGSEEFYSSYEMIQHLGKKSGEPDQIVKFKVARFLPTQLGADSQFKLMLSVQNTGQTIWDVKNGDEFALVSNYAFKYFFSPIEETEPNVQRDLTFVIQTPIDTGMFPTQIALLHKGNIQNLWAWNMEVIPNIDLTIRYKLLLGFLQNDKNFQVEIYDPQEHLVFKKANIVGHNNTILLSKVKNLAVGQQYRVVLLKDGNLPRQEFVTVLRDNNVIMMKKMLPFDWDGDGAWTPLDLIWFLGRKK